MKPVDFLLVFILGVLVFPLSPAPEPIAPIPDPDVPVASDLWDEASDTYRVLTAEVFESIPEQEFKDDATKLTFILEHTEAARKASFSTVNSRIQQAVTDKKESELAAALKAKELK